MRFAATVDFRFTINDDEIKPDSREPEMLQDLKADLEEILRDEIPSTFQDISIEINTRVVRG